MSFFESLPLLPEDPILNLTVDFAADPRSHKVNLGVGAYKTAEGQPLVLSSVRQAEKILQEKNLFKEYLPIDGHPEYIKEILRLIYGKNSSVLSEGRVYGAQTIGGSGALRIGGEFLTQERNNRILYLSDPSWPNHKGIFTRSRLDIKSYAYYDQTSHCIDFAGMCAAIEEMSEGSVILLHGCCHNPTGMDPNFDQWKVLSELIKKRKIIPFFDLAYQGFDQGIEEDAKAVRYFAEQGHEMLVASSYSKNFGLYGERVGLLSVITSKKEIIPKVSSHIKSLIRGNYSTPPSQGARIISVILQTPDLHELWEKELTSIRQRIRDMRQALINKLSSKGTQEDFAFLKRQCGIFSFSGLNQDQVQRLRQDYALYMPSNGRINVAGLNLQNLDYVVDSILAVY